MEVIINGKPVKFIRKYVSGATSSYYFDADNQYFLKRIINYQRWHVLEREVYILKMLQRYPTHFPKYVTHSYNYIVMKWAGDKLTCKNKPRNIAVQIEEILHILASNHIRHDDIKDGELLVHPNGQLVLVDFGWALINGSLTFGTTMVEGMRPDIKYQDLTDRERINNLLSNLS